MCSSRIRTTYARQSGMRKLTSNSFGGVPGIYDFLTEALQPRKPFPCFQRAFLILFARHDLVLLDGDCLETLEGLDWDVGHKGEELLLGILVVVPLPRRTRTRWGTFLMPRAQMNLLSL